MAADVRPLLFSTGWPAAMKIMLFANTDWYLFNFRRSLAGALRETGHEVLLISPAGPYGEELRRQGFRWLPAPMQRRSLNPLRELRLIAWLCTTMRNEAIDVVHGFTIKNAVYGSLAARLAAVPARVSAVTGMGYVFISNDRLARLLRPALGALFRVALSGNGTRLILQNLDDANLFRSAGLVDPDRIRVIAGSGVDCERFLPSTEARRDGPFRVLLPARLLWDKGLAELVTASRILRSEGLHIEFLLAGTSDPGNPASVPEADLAEWEKAGLVTQLGHVEDMPALFNAVDAVVLPSYREGLPKGLIEAAACGKPLITTDVPGCREVVTHGEDGLLVPVRDGEALAAAIRQLHDDPDLCRRLGTAAREKTLALFDEKIVIAQTMAVYEELAVPEGSPARRSALAAGSFVQ